MPKIQMNLDKNSGNLRHSNLGLLLPLLPQLKQMLCQNGAGCENKQLFCCSRKRFTWFWAVGNIHAQRQCRWNDYLRDGRWQGLKALLAQGCGHGWGKFITGWGCMHLQQRPEKVQPVTYSWLKVRLCTCQEERWKDPVEFKRWERLENGLNFECATYPHADPLRDDKNLTGSGWLNIIPVQSLAD